MNPKGVLFLLLILFSPNHIGGDPTNQLPQLIFITVTDVEGINENMSTSNLDNDETIRINFEFSKDTFYNLKGVGANESIEIILKGGFFVVVNSQIYQLDALSSSEWGLYISVDSTRANFIHLLYINIINDLSVAWDTVVYDDQTSSRSYPITGKVETLIVDKGIIGNDTLNPSNCELDINEQQEELYCEINQHRKYQVFNASGNIMPSYEGVSNSLTLFLLNNAIAVGNSSSIETKSSEINIIGMINFKLKQIDLNEEFDQIHGQIKLFVEYSLNEFKIVEDKPWYDIPRFVILTGGSIMVLSVILIYFKKRDFGRMK